MASVIEYDELVNRYYDWCRDRGYPSISGNALSMMLEGGDAVIALDFWCDIVRMENLMAKEIIPREDFDMTRRSELHTI